MVIWGSSGSGKSTLCNHIIQNKKLYSKFQFCISYTTRLPREGEVDGKDYNFVSVDEFLKIREQGEFAEYREIYGNFYGTPKSILTEIVSRGKIPILHFGLTGVKSFLENYPDANTVFITLTNVEEVRKRLEDRGSENGEMLEKRIRSFEKCQDETT